MLPGEPFMICGIDYGSKLAGTTVLASGDTATGIVSFCQSKTRQDADIFLLHCIQTLPLPVGIVCVDAPLSLPGVYRQLPGYDDYFYRTADRKLQAMSPMFLGGLTARAMRFSKLLEAECIEVRETYPAAQARRLQLFELGYKQARENIAGVLERIQVLFPEWKLGQPATNWHQVDALLAMIGAYRFVQKVSECAGDEPEGVIHW